MWRTRTSQLKYATYTVKSSYYVNTQGQASQTGTHVGISSPEGGRIVDIREPGWVNVGRIRRRAMKPVFHERWHDVILPSTAAVLTPMGPGWQGTWYLDYWEGTCRAIDWYQNLSTWNVGACYAADLIGACPKDIYSGHYGRWGDVRPSMASRANLSVFLYELRDIKRMFDILPSRHLNIQRRSVKDWRMALKYANSQHLNYNFGWKPFVKDVKNVFRGLTSFDERLNRFLSNAGKAMTTHRAGDSNFSVVKNSTTYRSLNNAYWETTVEREYRIQRASTFDYQYAIPNYGAAELKVRSMLDTLGLHIDPATLWQVVPWSFVVDWFIGVGSYLDQFSLDWTLPWITLFQACSSMKVEAKSSWKTKFLLYGVTLQKPVGGVSSTMYYRCTGLPDWQDPTPPLNDDKIRLLGSLFASRIL